MITTITCNVAGTYAWIPPHGKTMAANDEYKWEGNVFDYYATRRGINRKVLKSMLNDIFYGKVTVSFTAPEVSSSSSSSTG